VRVLGRNLRALWEFSPTWLPIDLSRALRKPSPAMAVALLALFVALGGTAIAAKHYVITSTKQIKPNVLRYLKGATGARGPQGAVGPTGIAFFLQRRGPIADLCAAGGGSCATATSTATCKGGSYAMGGGFWTRPSQLTPPYEYSGAVRIVSDRPSEDFTSWVVTAVNTGPDAEQFVAYVNCVVGNFAVVPSKG
jgi:hypothetical protein